MVLHAIRAARRFIYIEDQYLVNLEISRALIAALPNLQHVTILIPHSSLLSSEECPQQHHRRRRDFIAPLRATGGNKVRVFYLSPPGSINTYVHAKMWVFDDEFAIIGSANVNRRGYRHDSEVAAAIFDPSPNPFAKRLRMALWAKHLNMNNSRDLPKLQDGVTGAGFWLDPPRGAHIAAFNENASISTGGRFYCRLLSWDGQIDPDGS
jgi:phosphatidylserine/phosphatidylglycerophosphate/cardiolipin synthase-like enzyme